MSPLRCPTPSPNTHPCPACHVGTMRIVAGSIKRTPPPSHRRDPPPPVYSFSSQVVDNQSRCASFHSKPYDPCNILSSWLYYAPGA